MKLITEAEYDIQGDETLIYEQEEFDTLGFDELGTYKNYWGTANYRFTASLMGIRELAIWDRTIDHDSNSLIQHDETQFFTSKFYLAGHHSVVCPGIDNIPSEYIERGGSNYLFYLPDLEEIEQDWQGDHLHRVKIEIDLATIRSFITEFDTLPIQLKPLVEQEKPPRFYYPLGKITPAMRSAIEQMLHHPYQGAISKMYLQGKVWELLAMQLAQLLESESNPPQRYKLTARDIDRLNMAKEILRQNYVDPPSVMELAQQVELEHMKLKRGFRQQFKTTPFGYVRNYRLQQAYQLLREGNSTVNQVVTQLGRLEE